MPTGYAVPAGTMAYVRQVATGKIVKRRLEKAVTGARFWVRYRNAVAVATDECVYLVPAESVQEEKREAVRPSEAYQPPEKKPKAQKRAKRHHRKRRPR